MRIAALADIHGNADALQAVIGDLFRQTFDAVVVLGDHFSGPLAARETAELLAQHPEFRFLRGNHDRYLLEHQRRDMGASDAVAFDDLRPESLTWLGKLPSTDRIEDVFLCHGTPESDEAYLCETVTADGLIARHPQASIAGLLTGIDASLILCGHSHLPQALTLKDGRQVVNPGSVGCPGYTSDMPRDHHVEAGFPEASYAVLERVGGRWVSNFKRVPYDSRRMVALAVERGRAEWASVLATGWITP